MVKEWWSSVLKEDCMQVIHSLSTEVCIMHKYTRVAMGQDGVEVKSIIDQ